MSTLQFKRAPRMSAPKPPGGEVHLEPPPEVPRSVPGNVLMKILPVVMIVAMLGMVAFIFTQMDTPSPFILMMPMMMIMSMVGMFAGGNRGGGPNKAEMNEDRKDYLRYLGQMRERARDAMGEQRAALEWVHPDPQMLWSLAGSRRMWERRHGDSDFLHLRVGRSSHRIATRLVPPQAGPVDELEPIATLALRRFVRAHSIVPDLPTQITLKGFAAVSMQGERELVRGLARAMLAQMVTFHSPEELLVGVASAGRAKEHWEWAKWLPHVQHPTLSDGIGQLRMMSGSLAQIEGWLEEELRDRQRFQRNAPAAEGPHIVIIVDEADITRDEQILLEEGLSGVTLVDVSESLSTLAGRRGLRLVVEEERVGARSAAGVEWFGRPDSLTVAETETLARTLSPYRVGSSVEEATEDEPLLSNPSMLELLGIPGDPMTFDVQQAWRPRPIRDRYRVPFGVGEYGQPVELDIKEAAMEGMGPHGLCIGATGSGKSEFLRTLVLAMMATHSSTALNFVLVDFKGGATFLGLDKAPHVSAVITNLEGEVTLVDRMRDALAGEMNRRQEALKNGGNFKNVWEYEKARENGADLDPLPALFIVVDEFSELLSAKPDFTELFVAIGRLGRSLQMHMLLASQRLEEGKLKGLDSHLSYRIGLKTFSAAESRTAIGVPDAFELPNVPGGGYLKYDTSTLVRFKASYVSGPYRPAGIKAAAPGAQVVRADKRPQMFVPDFVELPAQQEPEPEPEPEAPAAPESEEAVEPSELDVIVNRLVGQGPPAHEVWLPPLDASNSLDTLLPNLNPTEARGLSPVGYFGNGRLQVPLGIVDRPYEQRRDPLWADFSGGAGHGAVVGGPQAGKSMALRTLVMSMALTHTPEEAQFYCVDLGGGTLASLSGLPHVGGVAVARRDPDKARRIVAELTTLVSEREARFGAMGIDSMNEFRNRKRKGEITAEQDAFGDAFLIVDGWRALRDDFEELEPQITRLAVQGLTYGVHVVVASNRWADIRPAIKDMLGTRFELRLGDPSESDISRKVAANVPAGRPGRGMTPDGLHMLIGLPRVDGSSDAEEIGDGVADAVRRVSAAWTGRHAPPVRLLPDVLPYQELLNSDDKRDTRLVPIGVDEDELAPVYLDFDADPHFIIFADGESGKTNLLRQITRGITERYTAQEALIILVDYRRTMLGFVEGDQLLSYVVSSSQLDDVIKDVSGSMSRRLPGPDITQEQLKSRSWWSGPELFLLVDDYDLVATNTNNPLRPLGEYLAQAKDVGLHMVVARRTGGAARSGMDPVLGKLREIAAPGIVMNGSKDEGQLLGNVKPSLLPPGRGTLVSRKIGKKLMHVSWIDPD